MKFMKIFLAYILEGIQIVHISTTIKNMDIF